MNVACTRPGKVVKLRPCEGLTSALGDSGGECLLTAKDRLVVGASANRYVGGRVSQRTVWASAFRRAVSRDH